MKPVIYFIIIVAVSIHNCQSSARTLKEVTQDDLSPKTNEIDRLVDKHCNSGMFSGSILVAENGEIIYQQQCGYLDIDSTVSINEASVFEIASLSKQFTAFMIMVLKQQGKLDYGDLITEYFPELPYQDITIRHLLTHTSGLSERQFFQWAGQHMRPPTIYHNEFILNYLITEQPELAFAPGNNWEYSNLGYFLLPLIIQQKTGMHYIDYLEKSIVKPLGLENTGVYSQEFKGSQMDNYAFGRVFNPQDSAFMSSFGMAWSDSIYGGVGIISNAEDLFKWDQALYSDTLIDSSSLYEAFEPYQLSNDGSSGYGFGWFVDDDQTINGMPIGKILSHYGLWPGYESSIVRFPEKKKTIIILANQSPSSKDVLKEEISSILFSR